MFSSGISKILNEVPSSSWRHLLARSLKVAIVGAGGGIGQPLSLLLRQSPGITELALHDLNGTRGLAADHSHICTDGTVKGFVGEKELEMAISNADVVVVAAGMPRLPGMERDQLMAANGNVALKVANAISVACPRALVAFITNPINMIVPAAAEILKATGVFDPKRLFGITTLDVVRSRKFIADHMDISPLTVDIPVIGGHAGITILPLFSQCQPHFQGDEMDIEKLTNRIQEAGTEVVNAKAGKGSATLSMAYAGAKFVDSLLRALRGQKNVVECAFVASNLTDAPFFASPLKLGTEGISRHLDLPKLNKSEVTALEKLVPILKKNAEEGTLFAKKSTAADLSEKLSN